MRVTTMIVGTLLSAMFTQAGVAADDFLDVSRLYGDFNVGSAGNELAVPRWTFVDTNANGYPDYVNVWFDTYTAGTSTKLYSSTSKAFALPALPAGCSPTVAADDLDFNPKVMRRDEASRIHLAMGFSLWCYDGANWQERDSAAIYSASVASAGGSPWKYASDNVFLVGVNGIDTDGDTITDSLALIQAYDLTGGSNAMMVIINATTGVVTSKVHYPIIRE